MPRIMMMKPTTIIICAKVFSALLRCMIFTKQVAGKRMQTRTPMVDPTNDIITSTDGINMPSTIVEKIMKSVSGLYFDSGTYEAISEW